MNDYTLRIKVTVAGNSPHPWEYQSDVMPDIGDIISGGPGLSVYGHEYEVLSVSQCIGSRIEWRDDGMFKKYFLSHIEIRVKKLPKKRNEYE